MKCTILSLFPGRRHWNASGARKHHHMMMPVTLETVTADLWHCKILENIMILKYGILLHVSMQFEMRLQTVVGEFYSEVVYNFNFETP